MPGKSEFERFSLIESVLIAAEAFDSGRGMKLGYGLSSPENCFSNLMGTTKGVSRQCF